MRHDRRWIILTDKMAADTQRNLHPYQLCKMKKNLDESRHNQLKSDLVGFRIWIQTKVLHVVSKIRNFNQFNQSTGQQFVKSFFGSGSK